MDIGMLAICIGVIVAAYNLFVNLRGNRNRNKQGQNNVLKALTKSLALGFLAFIIVVNIDFGTKERVPVEYETEESLTSESGTSEDGTVEHEAVTESEYKYTFRTEELLTDHYEKHGIYMKYKKPEQYLKGANRVIADPETLHAIEAEDGDDVYYLQRSNEFVVVSQDGYIRTYFCPEDGIEYFHRQYE